VLCGCGHNLRKILAHLRAWLAQIMAAVLDLLRSMQNRRYGYATA
jgi:IS5 family transposase